MAKTDPQQLTLDKALLAAAASSSALKVRSALDFGANVNFQAEDQCGWSALHFACYFSGHEKTAERICKMLITRGADVNLKASDGATPLLTAASIGSAEVVRLLLDKRAKVDAVDKLGGTPLMCAADRGDDEIVDALLSAGADPSLRDAKGMTAIDLALKRGRHAIASQIEASMLREVISVQAGRARFKA